MVFPANPREPETTVVVLAMQDRCLPRVVWLGTAADIGMSANAAGAVAAAGEAGSALLPEHWTGLTTRPGLRGYRVSPDASSGLTGRDWSPKFELLDVEVSDSLLQFTAEDVGAGLSLITELESLVGGGLRIRHRLTNTGRGAYVVESLDVVIPIPEWHDEVLDFSGRHERERFPQRHPIADGLWLREGRQGRTGLDASTMLITGAAGFGFAAASVVAVHVGWSGNVALRLERGGATGTTAGGGEHLLPGEIALADGEEYSTPWVFVAASRAGLDGVAHTFHQWLRSLPGHPKRAPVTLNVWEAVYFDHDLNRLKELADRAARIGVERYVLDDGWFHLRRDDHAGLGDWWIDTDVWPDGLGPIVDHVTGLGMEFGLWFEPEMVNPDSDLYRAHPDWILSAGDRTPLLRRNQLVLDLSRQEVWQYLYDQMDAVLGAYDIRYVKWDHNRDLLDAGSGNTGGAPAVHRQTAAFYRLLDALRTAHPTVAWESCASGGGRIDLGVLERVQRVWTSDMTEALARQSIQRWMVQLVAPEYLGAHISAPTSHQTARTLPLEFRAATALFGAFGIEWDISRATEAELDTLAEWVARFKGYRPLLHSGRVVRVASSDPAVIMHGVVSADRSEALMAHVQLDESAHNRGVRLRVPGLEFDQEYEVRWEAEVDQSMLSVASPVPAEGPTAGVPVSGRVLSIQGVWIPRRRPETILLVHVTAVS